MVACQKWILVHIATMIIFKGVIPHCMTMNKSHVI